MARFENQVTKKIPPPAKPRAAHDFRDANRIPYIKRPAEIYLYPHAESHIPQEHNERYPHLVDILKSVVEQNPKLAADRNWLAGTCYSMYMCGRDKDTAVPSIVVFCSQADLSLVKCLRRTLAEQHVAAQYNSPTGPRFKIYIWAGAFALCGGSGDVVEIHLDGRTTTCGAQVTNVGSSINLSTVAVVLEINSCFYALTSAHGIVSRPAQTHLDQRNHSPPGLLTKPPVDPPSLCETEYDFDGLLDLPWPMPQDSPPREKYVLDPIRCQVLRTPNDEEWHKQEPNLDFSLLQLGNPEAWTLNTYKVWSADSGSAQNIRVEKTPAVRPSSARQVRIIGPSDDTVVGTIRSTPSFILNSLYTEHLCEVWTVSPHDKNRIAIGASGSLVVDLQTSQPYGHVIALNPIGEVYMVPLQSTLRQIKKMFSSDNVGILLENAVEPPTSCAVKSWIRSIDEDLSRTPPHDSIDQYKVYRWITNLARLWTR